MGTKSKPGKVNVRSAPHKHRNLMECFFDRVERFRRIATRYAILARNFKLHSSVLLVGCEL